MRKFRKLIDGVSWAVGELWSSSLTWCKREDLPLRLVTRTSHKTYVIEIAPTSTSPRIARFCLAMEIQTLQVLIGGMEGFRMEHFYELQDL